MHTAVDFRADSRGDTLVVGVLAVLSLVLAALLGCNGVQSYQGRTQADRPAHSPARPLPVADGSLPLDEAVATLAELVVETLPLEARCAIYPPEVEGRTTGLSSQLATELETEAALAASGRARIITRSQLSVVLDEQNLQLGDLTHPDTQVQVGHMLGATHIVTGNLVKLSDDRMRWTMQVIDLTDGTVLGGTRLEVRLNEADVAALEQAGRRAG